MALLANWLDGDWLGGENIPGNIMTDETPTPRGIHLLTIDSLLSDLIGGRAVALGGGEELALASDDARAVLDWYRRNRGKWQSNLSASDTDAIIDTIGTPPQGRTARGKITETAPNLDSVGVDPIA